MSSKKVCYGQKITLLREILKVLSPKTEGRPPPLHPQRAVFQRDKFRSVLILNHNRRLADNAVKVNQAWRVVVVIAADRKVAGLEGFFVFKHVAAKRRGGVKADSKLADMYTFGIEGEDYTYDADGLVVPSSEKYNHSLQNRAQLLQQSACL